MQHTATHCRALQHTATHCNTLPGAATHYALEAAQVSLDDTQYLEILENQPTSKFTMPIGYEADIREIFTL